MCPLTGRPAEDLKTFCILTPTTLPFRSNSGPLLIPGLIAASVSRSWMPYLEGRSADPIPRVTVGKSRSTSTFPVGKPVDMTSSPTRWRTTTGTPAPNCGLTRERLR